MSEGRLRCCGSPLFLKTRFGAGYILSLTKDQHGQSRTVEPIISDAVALVGDNNSSPPTTDGSAMMGAHESSVSSTTMDSRVLTLIQSTVPEAKLVSSVAGEFIINLPITSSPLFGPLFESIKINRDALHIGSYGICMTTLEQVFIQLSKEKHMHVQQQQEDEEDAGLWQHPLHGLTSHLPLISHPLSLFTSLHTVAPRAVIPHEPLRALDTDPSADTPSPPLVEMVGMNHERSVDTLLNAPLSLPPHLQPMKMSESSDHHDHTNAGANSATHLPLHTHDGISKGQDEVADPADEIDWASTHIVEKISIQLIELLRKRYLIATRDLNGLFFQVILPAIQIALVLSILTITVSPAGHTLTLNSAMFPIVASSTLSPIPAESILSGEVGTDIPLRVESDLNTNRMRLIETNATTSYMMSE
jgi:hypothetical protein